MGTPLNMLSAIADSSVNAVVTTDAAGRITWVNATFTRMTGYPLDDAVGKTPAALLQGPGTDPQVIELMSSRLRQRKGFSVEVLNYRADGTPFRNHVEVIPVLDDAGELQGFASVQVDTSSARQHAEELERSRNEAIETERLKSRFLAVMSHEIRTPINGIIGLLDLALVHRHPDTMRRHLSMARGLATSLTQVVNDTLDLSRMDAGKLVLQEDFFDPEALVLKAVSAVASEAHRKGVKINVSCPMPLPVQLRGAPSRIEQILINLLGNATKFTDVGAVGLTVEWDAEATALTLSVSDTGPGIPSESLEKIFEPYEQVCGSPQARHKGFGLGLSIVHRLVELLGGGISVQSELGAGTTFEVWLPFGDSPPPDSLRADGLLEDVDVVVSDTLSREEPDLFHWLEFAGARVGRCDAGRSDRVPANALCIVDASESALSLELAEWGGRVLVVGTDLEPSLLREPGESRALAFLTRPLLPRSALQQISAGARLRMPMAQRVAGSPGVCPVPVPKEGHDLLLVEDDPVSSLVAEQFLRRAGWRVRCTNTAGEAIESLRQGHEFRVVLVDMNLPDGPGLDVLRELRARRNHAASAPRVALWSAQSPLADLPPEYVQLTDVRIPKPIEPAELVRAVERLAGEETEADTMPHGEALSRRATADASSAASPRHE